MQGAAARTSEMRGRRGELRQALRPGSRGISVLELDRGEGEGEGEEEGEGEGEGEMDGAGR